jgi:hypothetical protein
MPGTTARIVTAGCALAAGTLLLLAPGCSSAPGEGYETLSPQEAEQIEQARRDRAQAEDDEAQNDPVATSNTQETGSDWPAEASSASPLVLAAAQTAAAATRPTGARPEGAELPANDTTDPWASTANSEQNADSQAAAASVRVGGTAVEMAADRAASAVQGEPIVRTIQLLVPEQSFSVEGPDDAIRISYDDFDLLKVLNMEPVPVNAVDHFPKWLSNLDGKRVRVRGFMYPTFQETDIPGFVLARDNQICCFGRNPKIYDLVEVTLRDGVTTDYIQGRPFDVVGIFHISPEADGDELWQLYQMTDAVVIDE